MSYYEKYIVTKFISIRIKEMRQIIFIISFLILNDLNAYVVGTGTVNYQYTVYHEPTPTSYVESKTLGTSQLIGTGKDGYYEQKWSNTYTTEIFIAGGKELNEARGSFNYTENSVYIIVMWSNGGK